MGLEAHKIIQTGPMRIPADAWGSATVVAQVSLKATHVFVERKTLQF